MNRSPGLDAIHFDGQGMPLPNPVPGDLPNPVPGDLNADWRRALPILRCDAVTARELVPTDAQSLMTLLTTADVTSFISPPPTSVAAFARFIEWTQRQRHTGAQFCFGLVPRGCTHAVGLVQVRQLAPPFALAECGFALGSPFWGTGMFMSGATMVFDFAFRRVGIHRLEARAAVENARGNAALRKLGAAPEGILRSALVKDGRHLDQVLWSIVGKEWRRAKAIWSTAIH